MTETRFLPIDQVQPHPGQPRKYFEPNALAELAASIRQHGLMQPITVRPVGDAFQIVAGERRYRASILAALAAVECRIVEGLDDEQTFILSVTENVLRADMTIVEEARAFAEIMALGKDALEVAHLFGKSASYVTGRVALLSLRDDLLHLVDRGQMPKPVALAIAKLDLTGQAAVVAKMASGELTADGAIERYAKALLAKSQQPSMFGEPPRKLSEETRQAVKRTLETSWGRAELIASALKPLLEMTPEELSAAMGAETGLYRERMAMLERTICSVKCKMLNAEAVYQATITELVPVALAAD